MGEVLLCFSVMQMSFACAECIARGFSVFSFIVNKGEFDRMLVRPVSPILQVLGTRFEIGRIGPMISAIVMFFMKIQITLVGTSLLIVVGVALELKRQLESNLVMRTYQGFLK